MRESKPLFVALLLLICQLVRINGKEIVVVIECRNDLRGMRVDDGITVGALARDFLRLEHETPNKHLRVEGRLGYTYSMSKTLKDAGIIDGSKVSIKVWSRAEDIGNGIMRRLTLRRI